MYKNTIDQYVYIIYIIIHIYIYLYVVCIEAIHDV